MLLCYLGKAYIRLYLLNFEQPLSLLVLVGETAQRRVVVAKRRSQECATRLDWTMLILTLGRPDVQLRFYPTHQFVFTTCVESPSSYATRLRYPR